MYCTPTLSCTTLRIFQQNVHESAWDKTCPPYFFNCCTSSISTGGPSVMRASTSITIDTHFNHHGFKTNSSPGLMDAILEGRVDRSRFTEPFYDLVLRRTSLQDGKDCCIHSPQPYTENNKEPRRRRHYGQAESLSSPSIWVGLYKIRSVSCRVYTWQRDNKFPELCGKAQDSHHCNSRQRPSTNRSVPGDSGIAKLKMAASGEYERSETRAGRCLL